jgi:hypothetical protein
MFSGAVKHLDEMDFFISKKLLESLCFLRSFDNLWVFENVRQLECILFQGSYNFQLAEFLFIFKVDLFQLTESFGKLSKISFEWRDLCFLSFDNLLKLGVIDFLIVEFKFEVLNLGFKLVKDERLDTFKLKSVESSK